MTTAQLVREARRGGGLTQRALAEKAGIAQPALAAIESSAHDTRAASLERLPTLPPANRKILRR